MPITAFRVRKKKEVIWLGVCDVMPAALLNSITDVELNSVPCPF